ncbi:IseA DL-endopeptidase inhibitor family protein [Peribacillus sp. ACCC06369]|uniref:IseA DL-endopeptidase inhibitor family protein n=1 Tax=Peribacillus sp. ACCC06369 TaxID=3055860 RepID=UPI0025A13722|nr:IseA DL-endopeptidase inhibitor family protein [Peribacillus sp. ACCC06369]MDM5358955.1 IseA DL-endopeptidase inhibitor family protein [Peribacillus sp. ACCC06369]
MKKFSGILLSIIILFFTLSAQVTAQTTSQNLSNVNALKIADNASKHFWNALHGYTNRSCSQKTFNYKGTEYSYLCQEFNTKAKLTNYLAETFTNNAVEKGLNKYNYITHKGKLARPIGDGDSMLLWKKAKIKLVYQKLNVRSYNLTVPTVDGESVKRTVTFYKSGSKWKVNQFDAVQ